jgi:hypothetical protein
MENSFEQCQQWEREWWGNCCNQQTFQEILKQDIYMPYMGLQLDHNGDLDLQGKQVLNIGGGPVSMLLRAKDATLSVVADPLNYPPSVHRRYRNYGIRFMRSRGEALRAHLSGKFNEVWMYNVLQHTPTPEKIIKAARQLGEVIRIFDWVNVGICPGHPSNLTAELFHKGFEGCTPIGRPGVVQVNHPQSRCVGQAFVGIYRSEDLLERLKTAGDVCQRQGWEIREGDPKEVSGSYLVTTTNGLQRAEIEDGEIVSIR